MNILFLTLVDFNSFKENNIYCDLLRKFTDNNDAVFCVSPTEKRNATETHLEENGHLLKLKIGNIQKTNIIEKGISTVILEPLMISGIKKYFGDIHFDLVMYATPPVTFCKVVEYIKNRDGAATYLLLKDIFPQNSIDMGMMSKTGVKGILYKFFRKKEKRLYSISDKIGCMSEANVKYLLKNNPEISPDKVEVCPNSIEPRRILPTDNEIASIRSKYGIPSDKTVFVYGGNLGKPQGIPMIISCLRAAENIENAYFLIVGNGTEYGKLKKFIDDNKPKNVKLMKALPIEDYDRMIAACDVGMIFLDHRFTIPNFPSRLLSYMQAGLPVISCTDRNTDMGDIIEKGGFGWKCYSDNPDGFVKIVDSVVKEDLREKSERAFEYLLENYTVSKAYETIIASISDRTEKAVENSSK